MRYAKVAENAANEFVWGAGILCRDFDPETGEVSSGSIIGATTGQTTFKDVPTFIDDAEDVNNAPANMMEFMRIGKRDITLAGTYVSVSAATIKKLMASADVDGRKITPRDVLKASDFEGVWWVQDYTKDNSDETGGALAIHLMNGLNTDGLTIQSGSESKAQFPFTYRAHYSVKAQGKVPYEVYIRTGESEEETA